MTFQYPTPPDPSISYVDVMLYKRATEDLDKEGTLFKDSTLNLWFIINVCELALGEDAHLKYTPREIFEKLEEFSKDAQAYTDLLEEHDVKVHIDDMEYQRQCSH